MEFTGRLLGAATSESDFHTNHPGDFAAKGEKCSGCRWFEVAIYRRDAPRGTGDPDVDYVVFTLGHTDVPGERLYGRITQVNSPFEVVEVLTVRRVGATFMPAQSSRALAQAAAVDAGLRDAYVNRAVV